MSQAEKIRTVKGRVISWGELKLRIRSDGVSEELIDFSGFKYEQKIERERPKGKGIAPRGKTSGEYSCTSSLTLKMAERIALMEKLKAASPTGRICDVDFDVVANWTWPGDDIVYAAEARDCSFDSSGVDASPSGEAIQFEHDLGPTRVYEGKDGNLMCLCEVE